MGRHDFFNAVNIVPEAIHERRVLMKQVTESIHVVTVPGGLERSGRLFRVYHSSHKFVLTMFFEYCSA